ncbi:hypothetical protein P43SY_004138 [Pythium insidiosum]|uniref:Uncharacterized protein n=1 Tax=Pythium insidiosum TaxID=114742 RepID=A0AAD5Q5T0_PYTIN|nr:hypothetical protein P43SY_004138 [Pythium insidiosum]
MLSCGGSGAAYAHDVLADRYLLSHIVSYQCGVPGCIVALEREHADRMGETGILASLAIERGSLRTLQALVQVCEDFPWYKPLRKMDLSSAMDAAALHGRLEMLQWMHEHTDLECLPWTFAVASRAGHRDVVQWLFAHHPESMAKFEPFSMDRVAEEGHLELFQWLEIHVCVPCTPSAMDSAALCGRLEMVRYLHEHRTEGCTTTAMDLAALKGHLDVVRFLHEHRSEGCTPWAMDSAAAYGRMDVLRFLHENRGEGCTVRAMNDAAGFGRMDVVRFLHENRNEGCDRTALRRAAKRGNLEMLRFLHENYHQHCSRDGIMAAAEEGHLEAVRYLNETCSASSGLAITNAAVAGHLDIVQYLVETRNDGCLLVARDKAAKAGQTHVVEYLETLLMPGLERCGNGNHTRVSTRRVCQRVE